MRITGLATDRAVLGEVGARIEAARLQRNWTRRRLADETGVGVRTLARLESGQGATLVNVVRVLRGLGLLEALDRALPEAGPTPMQQLRLGGRRRRARPRRGQDAAGDAWTWGDPPGGERA